MSAAAVDARRTSSTTFAGRVRHIATSSNKPCVEVVLDNDDQRANGYGVHTFSTFDKMEGYVAVIPAQDTKVEKLDISFVGNAKSVVDKMATASAVNSTSEAFQQFLKLSHPVADGDYPADRVLKAGVSYKFRFKFVVPEHLVINSCRHKCKNQAVKDAHLLLPPSLGDPETAGRGSTLLDDLAPSSVRISYVIRAQLTKSRERDSKEMILSERSRKVRIVPAFDETPPIHLDDSNNEDYCLRHEKSVRKGVFKGKLGRIAMEAAQPSSLRLPPPSDNANYNVTTTATVNLRFDPVDASAQPPKLSMLTSKLKSVTYWAARPQFRFPSKIDVSSQMIASMFEGSSALSSRCMANVQWTRHEPSDLACHSEVSRRDSAMSLETVIQGPAPTSIYNSALPFYTARLIVPVVLPKDKAFVPTFFSCLISRVYMLDMTLGMPSGLSSSMQLRVPVQISSQTDATAGRRPSQQNIVMLQDIEDEFFRPRFVTANRSSFGGSERSSSEDSYVMGRPESTEMLMPPPEYSAAMNVPRSATLPAMARTAVPPQASSSAMALLHAR